jgi:hypothetical protein
VLALAPLALLVLAAPVIGAALVLTALAVAVVAVLVLGWQVINAPGGAWIASIVASRALLLLLLLPRLPGLAWAPPLLQLWLRRSAL